MLSNLILATVMVAATVLVHFWGLISLTWIMGTHGARLRPHESRIGSTLLLLFVVFGIFAVHTVEIWLYAAVYLFLGETRGFEEALYFSTVTFSSIGYGDVVLSPRWRLLSSIEGANGVILFAWSTTFLFGVTTRLKILEHQWLDSGPRA
ncbi:MAG: potassium channel family protein [Pseudomonadota bacterium]